MQLNCAQPDGGFNMNLYDFKVMTRKGEEVSLDEYK